jgi:hypothetical protein
MLSEPGPGRSSINIHDHHLFVPLGEGVDETRVKSGYLVFFLFFCPVCGILFLGFLILFPSLLPYPSPSQDLRA